MFLFRTRPPPRSTLFPYTTLFRSWASRSAAMKSARAVSSARTTTSLGPDRKSTRLNSSHEWISYAVFCLKKKKNTDGRRQLQDLLPRWRQQPPHDHPAERRREKPD